MPKAEIVTKALMTTVMMDVLTLFQRNQLFPCAHKLQIVHT
jgi:hypothetical protein